MRANCLSLIDTGVDCIRILRRHLPEWIFDDDGGIIANAQFQKENFLLCVGSEKILIPLCCPVLALVLHKRIIAAEIHGHGFPAMGAMGNQFRRSTHILLLLHHLTNGGFVIKGFLTARLTALE